MTSTIIRPGATIGILGAGQLGKMSLMAADVVTTEWENIPVPLLQRLEASGKLVRPSSRVLAIAQSRRAEKEFAQSIEMGPVPYAYIPNLDALQMPESYAKLFPGIVKTDRLGYDGKGQVSVSDYEEMRASLAYLNGPCVVEKRLLLEMEVSAIVARNARGELAVSPIVANTHKDGILDTTKYSDAMGLTDFMFPLIGNTLTRAAQDLQLEGILAIEFFISGGAVWFNEMAPRPHNSFHGSIEAAYTSQFEQHIRAICNLPLGNMRFHSGFEMKNLIGDAVKEWEGHIQQQQTHVHLYGKAEAKPGRKMGHVTTLI